MPRENLNRQINHLQDEVLVLGSMVEQAMVSAVDTLKRRDIRAARIIFDDDHLLNEKRFAIENNILIVIATQQPMAHDLRLLAAMLEVINELERMGDYAKGVAKITIRLGMHELTIPNAEFGRMAELCTSMLHRALDAFISENASVAAQIPFEDNKVDDLFNQVYRQLISDMIAKPENIDSCNLLLWVNHNLERMADRVTNICERTIFIATGELMELDGAEIEEEEEEEADSD